MVEEGDTVDVGAAFFKLDTSAKAPEGGAAPKKEEAPAAEATPEPAAAVKDAPKPAAPAAAAPSTPVTGGTI